MAIRGGPDIIEDGLVLHLDAAEPLCFRGEPTTNLASYTNGNATRGSWPYGAYTHSIETTGEFAGWEKIVATSVGSATNSLIMYIGNFFATSGVQYTGSIEFYSPYNNLRFQITGGQGIGTATRIGSSNKYYRTFATTISTNMSWYLGTIASTPANTPITNGVIYYRRAQFEQKPYYTDFTIGTRGSTVATGGGLLDLTNNGNNGTITRAASPSAGFYNSNNGGSFVFDGANDYAFMTGVNTSSYMSMCCLFKTSSQQTNKYLVAISRDIANGGNGFDLCFQGGNIGSYAVTNGTNAQAVALSTKNYYDNQWHYIVASYNGSSLVFYYDGVQVSSQAKTGSILVEATKRLNIGSWANNSNKASANIAIVSLYNRGLTASEVLQNYNATKGRFGL